MPSPVAGFPVNDGDLVTYSWLNALGLRQLGDAQPTGASQVFTLPSGDVYSGYITVWTARTSQATTLDFLMWRWNGSSTAAYYMEALRGTGTAVPASAENLAQTSAKCGIAPGSSAAAGHFGDGVIFHPFVRSTDPGYAAYAAVCAAFNNTTTGTGFVESYGGMYGSGGALTSLTYLWNGGGNFVTGSRFTVYGVV